MAPETAANETAEPILPEWSPFLSSKNYTNNDPNSYPNLTDNQINPWKFPQIFLRPAVAPYSSKAITTDNQSGSGFSQPQTGQSVFQVIISFTSWAKIQCTLRLNALCVLQAVMYLDRMIQTKCLTLHCLEIVRHIMLDHDCHRAFMRQQSDKRTPISNATFAPIYPPAGSLEKSHKNQKREAKPESIM